MSYTAIGILLIWTIVRLTLSARWLNDLRIIHNHIAPDASDMKYMMPSYYRRWWLLRFRFSAMDPTKLTEPGRDRLKTAIWNERAIWAWSAIGLLLILVLGALG
ncbi:hypothetical protein ACQR10_08695 [Bradyrhizobium sp. HKCCYLRH2060]|uniref:hypothetical protein n=1 Tax=Bradyrhizobium TaxID=374 RepID=UPI002916A4C6|nr:hypothetical protein [Bradyrhizobium sp. SZCCHNR3003]